MESGITTLKDVFELLASIATCIGVIALIFGIYSYKITQKQLNFSVLERCITHFREKFISISNDSDDVLLKAYIDFVNEELFYFENNYIPKNVALEWIDGMLDYIPIYSHPKNLLNPEKAINKIHEMNLLEDYQRVKKAFTVKGKYEFKLIYGESEKENAFENRKKERINLSKEIYRNLA